MPPTTTYRNDNFVIPVHLAHVDVHADFHRISQECRDLKQVAAQVFYAYLDAHIWFDTSLSTTTHDTRFHGNSLDGTPRMIRVSYYSRLDAHAWRDYVCRTIKTVSHAYWMDSSSFLVFLFLLALQSPPLCGITPSGECPTRQTTQTISVRELADTHTERLPKTFEVHCNAA